MMPKTYKSHNMDTGVKARWILLRVILILFSFFEDSRAGGIPSFCNIPPVKEGGDGTLTCTFTENISVTKRDFEVDRYSSTNYKQDTLLVCTWIIDQPTCYLNPRITFDRVVTNTLKIKIPNVTSDDAGKYICYVLPTPNGISKSCNLMLEETTFIPATYEPRYPMPRSSDLPMIDTSTSIQDSKEDGIIPASVISIIIAVNITIFVLQGICCLLVIRYYKRRWTNDNDKNSNKKFINSKPIHGEEDENQLCGLLEKDTPIRDQIPMSCNLTSTSEVEPTDSGIVQYKNKYANTRERKLRSSIKRSSDELMSFDSRIVLIKNKSTNTRERRLRSSIKRRTSDDLISFDSRHVLSEDRHEHNTRRSLMSSLTISTSDGALSIDSGILLSDDRHEHNTGRSLMSSLTMSTSEDALSIDSGILLSDDKNARREENKNRSSLTVHTSDAEQNIDSENVQTDDQNARREENINRSSLTVHTSDAEQNLDSESVQTDDQNARREENTNRSSLTVHTSDAEQNLDSENVQTDEQYPHGEEIISTPIQAVSFPSFYDRRLFSLHSLYGRFHSGIHRNNVQYTHGEVNTSSPILTVSNSNADQIIHSEIVQSDVQYAHRQDNMGRSSVTVVNSDNDEPSIVRTNVDFIRNQEILTSSSVKLRNSIVIIDGFE